MEMSKQSSSKELESKSIVSEVMYRIYEVISKRDAILDELRARPSMVGSSSGNERLRIYAPTGPVEVHGGGTDGKISIEYTPKHPNSEHESRFMTFGISPVECFMSSKN